MRGKCRVPFKTACRGRAHCKVSPGKCMGDGRPMSFRHNPRNRCKGDEENRIEYVCGVDYPGSFHRVTGSHRS